MLVTLAEFPKSQMEELWNEFPEVDIPHPFDPSESLDVRQKDQTLSRIGKGL